MKKLLLSILFSVFLTAPLSVLVIETPTVEAKNTYKPKKKQIYIKGPRGGCYYINKNRNKTYVDRSLCK